MALVKLGYAFELTSEPSRVAQAKHIVLPGVGAFGDCMTQLKQRGLIAPIVERVKSDGVPFLGVCVGMQIMADEGEEFGLHKGLGLIPGVVRRLADPIGNPGEMRVPNIGWREVVPSYNSSSFGASLKSSNAYFVHSFAFEAHDSRDVAATIDFNGAKIAAILHRKNVVGFQFHPEKSGPTGLSLLKRAIDQAPVVA